MGKGLKKRLCWDCRRLLGFREFHQTNQFLSEEEAIPLWNNKHLEFYCCTCFAKRLRNHRKIDRDFKKILFIGLENSGKSAIIDTLRFMHVPINLDLLPTRGCTILDAFINGKGYVLWDLAGTLNYRLRWLTNHKKYFPKTEELFFVIDIQDPSKFAPAISYLKDIVQILKEYHHFNFRTLIILVHKSDPELVHSPEYGEHVETLRNHLEQSDLPNGHGIYATSLMNFDHNHDPETFNQEEFNSFEEIMSCLLRPKKKCPTFI